MSTQDDVDSAEWQAQERARRNERLQLEGSADDAASARYRSVARALRAAPLQELPPDFAQGTARLAQTRFGIAGERGIEYWLVGALLLVLAVAGVVTAIVYGAAWWQASVALLATESPSATGWLLTGAGCLMLTWLTPRVRPPVDAAR